MTQKGGCRSSAMANLGVQVVAEGVETSTAWTVLAGLGCAVAQGYILSPPMPASEFSGWTTARSKQVHAVP